jgi:hypothetical protein
MSGDALTADAAVPDWCQMNVPGGPVTQLTGEIVGQPAGGPVIHLLSASAAGATMSFVWRRGWVPGAGRGLLAQGRRRPTMAPPQTAQPQTTLMPRA